jgi:hydrogenase maturation protein HypF
LYVKEIFDIHKEDVKIYIEFLATPIGLSVVKDFVCRAEFEGRTGIDSIRDYPVQSNKMVICGDCLKRVRIEITGRVQGVGCRPFVWRIATGLRLSGWVQNDIQGVMIEAQGDFESINQLVEILNDASRRPPLMQVSSVRSQPIELLSDENGFSIRLSDSDDAAEITEVSVDTAVCGDCYREMMDPRDFRHRYPFINCTNCGPRYSIIRTVPYDRANTTMAAYAMCPRCEGQYGDPADRRFHAQPVACPACGPKIWLSEPQGKTIENDGDKVIATAARMLREGRIVAIKGIGGFHLAVDAFNEQAVQRLRQRKHRDDKPFAMMAASVEFIEQFAVVDAAARSLLTSPQAPIVLLDRKPNAARPIAPSVATGTRTLGFMLCYAPLHHLLFAEAGIELLVMTSANLADEPLICKNDEALSKLSGVADAFVMHDREIFRQLDDSVMHIVDGQPSFLRRARGFVPGPILGDEPASKEILACGADLKNTFCLVKGRQFILSEHIGDLEDGLVYRHYTRSIPHLRQLFDVRPQVVACDLHPGYLSTQYARSLGIKRVIPIQHHWAHIAAALAEYHFPGEVIGLVADGTGFGTDGAIWGCECLIASLESYRRFGHLRYYPLAGGDLAAKEAIRPLMGLLGDAIGEYDWLLGRIEPDAARRKMIAEQIARSINTVATSSLGRVFDAVAAMVGLGTANRFEAQLPMALEAAADPACGDEYPFDLMADNEQGWLVDLRPMLRAMAADIRGEKKIGRIAAAFHNSLAAAFLALARRARQHYNLDAVALSGGVFCNRLLANRLIGLLKTDGFRVLWKQQVPVNDGGIALGQAAIAAAMVRREQQ